MFADVDVIEDVISPAGELHADDAKVVNCVLLKLLLPEEQFDRTLQS